MPQPHLLYCAGLHGEDLPWPPSRPGWLKAPRGHLPPHSYDSLPGSRAAQARSLLPLPRAGGEPLSSLCLGNTFLTSPVLPWDPRTLPLLVLPSRLCKCSGFKSKHLRVQNPQEPQVPNKRSRSGIYDKARCRGPCWKGSETWKTGILIFSTIEAKQYILRPTEQQVSCLWTWLHFIVV